MSDCKIGAAYIRVSTDDQLEFSPDSQVSKIRDYAKANNILLTDEFIFMEEDGRSGRNVKHRPEFQRMIGIAKTKPKPFDVVLVWKFSRFARNREDSIVYKSMLRKQCGIDVISVSENIGDDKMSILIEAIIEAMDEWYSVNLADEVVRGMTEKAKRGGVVGSPAFGYEVKDGVFVPDAERADIVRLIFDKFVNEDMSYRTIAHMLNNLGIRTAKGGQLENRIIKYILSNPVYIGKIRWSTSGKSNWNYANNPNVVISDGHHEPIVSKELFKRAQKKAELICKQYPKYARKSNGKFMLQGLIRCSNCGSTLVRSGEGLQCHSYAKGTCDVSHYISKTIANQKAIEALEECFKEGNINLIIKKPKRVDNSEALICAQLQREKQKLERIKTAYENGIDTLEEYKENKEKVMQSIKNLKIRLSKNSKAEIDTKAFIKKNLKSLSDLRRLDLSEAEKNRILRNFIERIIFDRKKNSLQIYFYV